MFVIQINKSLIDSINKAKKCKKILDVSTIDFFTLHAKMPYTNFLLIFSNINSTFDTVIIFSNLAPI